MAAYLPSDEQRQLIESDDSAAVIAGPDRSTITTELGGHVFIWHGLDELCDSEQAVPSRLLNLVIPWISCEC
jgi:hypothetical protein